MPYPADARRILFATAEFAPHIKVGGLSEASAGLVSMLRTLGVVVDVVMPDYGFLELREASARPLQYLPEWCPEILAMTGWVDGIGKMTLLSFPGSARPHPYVNPKTGHGWNDNHERFAVFSAGVAQLAAETQPDVVHCNDWHSSAAIGRLIEGQPSVLTIHNLAHQGVADVSLAEQIGVHRKAFVHQDRYNPLAGAISLADNVILVSESYAAEALSEEGGFGLHDRLLSRGSAVQGIRNGIDLGLWHPSEDPLLPFTFEQNDLTGKELCRKELLAATNLVDDKGPVIGLVARLDHQKGIDLALSMAPYLEHLRARLVLIGSGSRDLARLAAQTQQDFPDRVHVFPGYDERLAHLVVAGSDLLLVPSRFEPCGLTQMQAMTCGTIPVVTNVGGLRDTVVDTDRNRKAGTGYVAQDTTALGVLDAIHRATRGWSNSRRRAAIQRRGMTADWSWAVPARSYLSVYNAVCADPLST